MPYFVIPDTSELMVRMMIMMGLVIRKITGRQTIQVIDVNFEYGEDICENDDNGTFLIIGKRICVLHLSNIMSNTNLITKVQKSFTSQTSSTG